MRIFSTCILIILGTYISSQYTETFDLNARGILSPGCTGSALSTCSNVNFAGVNWTLGGNLSGIDTEGFSTNSGRLEAFDTDEPACWISPPINISGVAGPVSLIVTFTIPSGSEWENSTTAGSIDFMDVEYSVDGGPYSVIPNVNGCPGSGHTISASSCVSLITGPQTFTPSVTGLTGSTLNVRVCIDLNASTDIGWLENVSVPESNATVPVELFSFDGFKRNEEIILKWSTASETNNNYFQLERSTNYTNFKTLTTINGAYNSIEKIDYSFVDFELPNSKDLYYRLKQVDFNGDSNYSQIIRVKNETINHSYMIYPNPFEDIVHINFNNNKNKGSSIRKEIQVFNILGSKIMDFEIAENENNFNIDLSILSSGSYYIEIIENNSITQTQRIIKL